MEVEHNRNQQQNKSKEEKNEREEERKVWFMVETNDPRLHKTIKSNSFLTRIQIQKRKQCYNSFSINETNAVTIKYIQVNAPHPHKPRKHSP